MDPDPIQHSLFNRTFEDIPGGEIESGRETPVYTVEELNLLVRDLLQEEIGTVWVEGELSGIKHYRSGGWRRVYGTIKDAGAEARIVIWEETLSSLRFDLEDGMKVLAEAEVSLYPQRGQYQLVIRQLKPAGVGELELAFQQLKERLGKEGLFDEERKIPLPAFPFCVGVVTSLQAAALRDFLEITGRRNDSVQIVIAPTRVQGEGAAGEIVAALVALQRVPGVECIVLTRGGGSLEDLWPFNEESVARAIASCTIPIISAVGHEIDWTISDMVADIRMPTPSAAAELVAWPASDWLERTRELRGRAVQLLQQRLRSLEEAVRWFTRAHGFRQMRLRVRELTQRLDEALRMLPVGLRYRIDVAGSNLGEARGLLVHGMEILIERRFFRLEQLKRTACALGPVAVLARGYAIARRPSAGPVVRKAEGLEPGEKLEVYFHEGKADVIVEDTGPGLEIMNDHTDSQGPAEGSR